jgi:hypothetical protein
MAAATCGAACDVPVIEIPAAVTMAPGANTVTNEAEFEKQATRSAAVTGSAQVP